MPSSRSLMMALLVLGQAACRAVDKDPVVLDTDAETDLETDVESDPPVDTDTTDTEVADSDTEAADSDAEIVDTDTGHTDAVDTDPVDSDVVDTDPVDSGDTDVAIVDTMDSADTDALTESGLETADTALPVGVPCGFNTTQLLWPVPGAAYASVPSFDELGRLLDCNADDEPGYAVVDVTGNGRPDLVVTDECNAGGGGVVGESKWLVWENTGAGHAGSPIDWDLPGGLYAGDESLDTISGVIDCGGGNRPSFSTLDIDGDGAVELVVTDDCNNAAIGEDYWLVYDNTGSGFTAAPVQWPVPGARYDGVETFDLLSDEVNCGGGSKPSYMLLDLDGDADPDLVVTDDCDDAAVGEDIWAWYKNLGTGFASSAGRHAVPGADYPGGDSFDLANDVQSCGAGQASPAHWVVDLSGDGLLDLVITDECNVGAANDVGELDWRVYLHTGTGFASSSVSWSVPGGNYFGPETFELLSQDRECTSNASRPTYALQDLSGAGRPDLIVLDDCAISGDVGERWWLRFDNLGDGFSDTPVVWSLPGVAFPGDESFDETSNVATCGGDVRPTFGLRDLNADGVPELVITDVCGDTAVGESAWIVYTAESPTCFLP